MFRSMTGYGREQRVIDGRDILVEIKSVNHRYFEFNARVPRVYGYLEGKIKSLVNVKTFRGKVDVNVSVYSKDGNDAEVNINVELAKGYSNALRSIKDELNLTDNLSLSTISRFQDIFLVTKTAEDEEVIWNSVKEVVEVALEKFVQMRTIEGERMLTDIKNRLNLIDGYITEIEEQSPNTISEYKSRMLGKIKEVFENNQLDEQRVLTEVAIFAEKIAVDEETVRLRSHLKQFAELLKSSESVGRKLDFLVQEINREVNTIGSKCQDLSVTRIVVEMKSEIEKIREQIQNVE